MTERIDDAFWTVFSGLPREGPGSDSSTLRALRMIRHLPPAPVVLDLGCGPGRQTLVLARTLNTRVVAIDIHQPFLDQLAAGAAAAGLSALVEIRRMSMDALDYPPGSVDLIWSEGAAYIVGIARALRLWRPLLREGGYLAFTEATWLVDDPPAEVCRFWRSAYPDITTVPGNLEKARAAEFDVVGAFDLPGQDWWTEYYTPLQARVAALKAQAHGRPDLQEAIASAEEEISMCARFGSTYGYVFYILQKKP